MDEKIIIEPQINGRNTMVSLIVYVTPLLLYALVVHRKEGIEGRKIAERLGLTSGSKPYYAWAMVLAFLGMLVARRAWQSIPASTSEQPQMAISHFAGQSLSFGRILSAVWWGMFETGLGEELLFRGLIAGWLGRRFQFWTANILQALVFTLPHTLILLVDIRLWPLAIGLPFSFGLISGWLRLKSGSVFPGWLVHGLNNVATAIASMH